MGPNDVLKYLSEAGCSPFFVTSALGSSVFGEIGRKHQAEMLEENIEFKKKMQELRDDFSEDRHDDQMLSMRELFELGRKYQQKQTLLINKSRKEEIEFNYFCQNNWPLSIEIQTALHEIEKSYYCSGIVKLDVIIARTDVNTYSKSPSCYDSFCKSIRDKAEELIPNISVLAQPWKKNIKSVSGIADAMNINFILRGKPTLVLFPYVVAGKFHLDFAYWSFNNTESHFLYQKTVEFPYSLTNPDDERISLALIGIIGFARDAYVVSEYHQPAIFSNQMEKLLKKYPEIHFYIEDQYKSLQSHVKALQASTDFRDLCSTKKYNCIIESLNTKGN